MKGEFTKNSSVIEDFHQDIESTHSVSAPSYSSLYCCYTELSSNINRGSLGPNLRATTPYLIQIHLLSMNHDLGV